MKLLFLSTWLLILGATYYAYNFYQKMESDFSNSSAQAAQSLQAANANNADLTSKISSLNDQIKALSGQLVDEKKKNDELRTLASVVPTTIVDPSPSTSSKPVPTSIPTIITTLSGKTYSGCVLSNVTPDGISFIHSTGVAKILFTDLDPTFSATFGYDPTAAHKYEQQQTAKAIQNDQQRERVIASERIASISQVPSSLSSNPSQQKGVTAPGLSQPQKDAIQAQISDLQSDIAFMQSEEAKTANNNHILLTDGRKLTGGAYAQKILEEQAQINQLQSQLK